MFNSRSEIYIPGDLDPGAALSRTTHLGIGAHQDDLEIMAIDGVLTCFQDPDQWFSGAVISSGSGSPRSGPYHHFSDEEMIQVRDLEQKRAAFLGDYSAQVFLKYSSSEIKDRENPAVKEEIKGLVKATGPDIIYTHNLADKHPTHVAVAVKTIQAIRELPEEKKPQKLFGCEVWRGLDWILDSEKVIFDCSEQQNIQAALLGVFDSQISGGKRYDLATLGRRAANATYISSHETDDARGMAFAMDLTPLILDLGIDILSFVQSSIKRFSEDVSQLIGGVK